MMPHDDKKVVERKVKPQDQWIVEQYYPPESIGKIGAWAEFYRFTSEAEALEYIRDCKFRLIQEARIEYSEEEIKG